jgi:hypothetical protein
VPSKYTLKISCFDITIFWNFGELGIGSCGFFHFTFGIQLWAGQFFLGQVWGQLLVCFMCFMKHINRPAPHLPQTITTMFTMVAYLMWNMVVFICGVHTKLWYLFFMHLKNKNWHHEIPKWEVKGICAKG